MTAQELVARAANKLPFTVAVGDGVVGFNGTYFYAEVEVLYTRGGLVPTLSGTDAFNIADEANVLYLQRSLDRLLDCA